MKAIQIKQTGGIEVLESVTEPVPPLANPGDVLIRVAFSGLNYIDTYHRTGLYPLPLPATLGREGSGIAVAVGPDVKHVKVGDRVAFFGPNSYAEYSVQPGDKVYVLPAGISLREAAAVLLQGLTVHALVRDSYHVKPGDTALVHAAAGGTGALLVQVLKIAGATVIGTVSSPAKAEVARKAGADHVINYSEQDFVTETKALTAGKGVNVVYDGVGATTWSGSLASLARRGFLVLFGNASGPVPPIDPLLLSRGGSLTLTRPYLMDFVPTLEEFLARCEEVFAWVAAGRLKLSVVAEFPLAESGKAHTLLESRGAAGKILLVVAPDLADK